MADNPARLEQSKVKANIKIVGIAPLLMCSIDSADKRNPIVQQIAQLTKLNKGKAYTEERQADIDRLHWLVALYQRGGRVVLPADNLLACVHEGAKLSKMGTAVKQAAPYTDHEAYALDHDGPKKDLDALYADGRFVDARMGCLQGRSKILVVRPVFPTWACSFDLTWDEEVVDFDTMRASLVDAGARRGVGTWRPRFGRFAVETFAA